MGPEATAELYSRIIRYCQDRYGAKYDSDYPEIFIYNLPIPDVVEGFKNKEEILTYLLKGIKKLEAAGCDFIAILRCLSLVLLKRL
jgi:aspartate racemase